MKSECPHGHTENLSHRELANRLEENDFECRADGCVKELSYEVDGQFWNDYVLGRDRRPFVSPDISRTAAGGSR